MKTKAYQNFEFLFQEHPTPMWIVRKHDLSVIEANEAILKVFKKRRNVFLKERLESLFPDNFSEVKEKLRKKTKACIDLGTLLHVTKKGKRFFLQTKAKHIKWSNQDCFVMFTDNASVSLHHAEAHHDFEKEIIEQKELSSSIINSLPGAFYLFDENGKFLRWNKNFETITGYSGEEISAMIPLDFFDEDEKALIFERISRVFVDGKADAQASFFTKSKTKIPYYFTGLLIDYEGKRCLIGMGIDISIQKEAEQEREELLTRLERLANNIPGGAFYQTLHTGSAREIVYISNGIEFILGRKPAELLNDASLFMNSIHPDDLHLLNYTKEEFDTIPYFDEEIRIFNTQGEMRWVNLRSSPQRVGDINIRDGFMLDITKRKQSEFEKERISFLLKEKEEQVTLLADNILQGAIYQVQIDANRNSVLSFISKGVEGILGFKPEAILGDMSIFINLIHAEDCEYVQRKGDEALLAHTSFDQEFRIATIRGDYRWVRAVSKPRVMNDQITLWDGLLVDITEHKNSLQEKEMLIKEIHHRVKNNLQLISSMLYLKMLDWDTPESKEFMTSMREKIKSVSLIHERLLQTESLDSIEIQDYLQKLISDIEITYSHQILRLSIKKNIERMFFSSDYATFLGQLVNELVINAIKHAFVNREKGEILVSLQKKENIFELVVQDDGVGLPIESDPDKTKSYGIQLVQIFTRQIKGTLLVTRHEGTRFQIDFKL